MLSPCVHQCLLPKMQQEISCCRSTSVYKFVLSVNKRASEFEALPSLLKCESKPHTTTTFESKLNANPD